MTSPRLGDDGALQNAGRWPVLRPHVVSLILYLTLIHIVGIWLFVTTRFPPPTGPAEIISREPLLGWSALEWMIACNFGWIALFVFELLLAKGMMPTARRVRRIVAGFALAGLAVVQIESFWVLAVVRDALSAS